MHYFLWQISLKWWVQYLSVQYVVIILSDLLKWFTGAEKSWDKAIRYSTSQIVLDKLSSATFQLFSRVPKRFFCAYTRKTSIFSDKVSAMKASESIVHSRQECCHYLSDARMTKIKSPLASQLSVDLWYLKIWNTLWEALEAITKNGCTKLFFFNINS